MYLQIIWLFWAIIFLMNPVFCDKFIFVSLTLQIQCICFLSLTVCPIELEHVFFLYVGLYLSFANIHHWLCSTFTTVYSMRPLPTGAVFRCYPGCVENCCLFHTYMTQINIHWKNKLKVYVSFIYVTESGRYFMMIQADQIGICLPENLQVALTQQILR